MTPLAAGAWCNRATAPSPQESSYPQGWTYPQRTDTPARSPWLSRDHACMTGTHVLTDAQILLRRQVLLESGTDDNAIRRSRSAGLLDRVRPGSYAWAERFRPLWSEQQHRLLVEATIVDTAEAVAVSHQSAIVLHRLPVWNVDLHTVHVTRPGSGGGHKRRWIHTHKAHLLPEEVVTIDGIPTTSVTRSTIDLARGSGFEAGVIAMDAALHLGLTSKDELAETCRAMRHKFGMSAARSAVAFSDGLSESVGESRSRIAMMRARLPRPRLQVDMWSIDDEHLGRVDFFFDEFRTAAEFDGHAKYGRLLDEQLRYGRHNRADAIAISRQAMITEKEREDAIRAIPLAVSRWSWRQIDDGHMVRSLKAGFTVGATLAHAPVLGRIG